MVVCWGRGLRVVIIVCINGDFCVSIVLLGIDVCKDVGDRDAKVIV